MVAMVDHDERVWELGREAFLASLWFGDQLSDAAWSPPTRSLLASMDQLLTRVWTATNAVYGASADFREHCLSVIRDIDRERAEHRESRPLGSETL